MTLNLLKRAEKGSALSSTEHDNNFTAIEDEVNAKQDNGAYEVAAFANLPAANSVTAGRVYTVLAPVCTGGAYGTRWVSDGTLWHPACGQVLWDLTTQVDGVSGGTTSEQFLASIAFPAGVFVGCRSIRVRSLWKASAADTNARTLRIRMGIAGTAADATIYSANAMTSAQRQGVVPTMVVPVSTTAVRHLAGSSGAPTSPDAVAGLTGTQADVTVGDMTGAMYISLTVQQGASPTSTMSLSLASVYVE